MRGCVWGDGSWRVQHHGESPEWKKARVAGEASGFLKFYLLCTHRQLAPCARRSERGVRGPWGSLLPAQAAG